MEGRGTKECRVCPAIKKWMKKHSLDDDKENIDKAGIDEGMSATKDQSLNEEVLSDATFDMKKLMTPDIRKSINALGLLSENLEQALEPANADAVTLVDIAEKEPKNVAKQTDNKSTVKGDSAGKAHERIIDNKTSTQIPKINDVDSAISVEDRARQIIQEVRKKEGRDNQIHPIITIQSPQSSHVDETAYFQGVAEARAEMIIERARATFRSDGEGGNVTNNKGEVSSEIAHSDVVTPELIVKKAKESLKKEVEESPTVKMAKESLKQSIQVSPAQVSVPLTPMTKLRKKQRNWLDYRASNRHMTSWDAARIIQSFARMVLSRKIFLDYLSDKRTQMYREMLNGQWEPTKPDLIFESRSRDREYNCKGDPDGEVQPTSSQVMERTESKHFDGGVDVSNTSDVNTLRNSVDPTLEEGMKGGKVRNARQGENIADTVSYNRYDSSMRESNDRASLMFDPKTLQIDHQLVHEPSTLPQAQVVYDAEVVNAADMVHCSTPMMYARDKNQILNFKACINERPIIDAEVVNTTEIATEGGNTYVRSDPPARGSEDEDHKRNAFTKVACSFDNAVSKVVSNMKDIVTCSGSGEMMKSQYKSAPVNEPSSDGTYFEESKRKAASYSIMYRTSLGWTIANHSCSNCEMPMMIRPDDNKLMCVLCDEADATDNATLGTMLSMSTREAKRITHVPTSIDTRKMTNIAVPRTRPIDPEPFEALESMSIVTSQKVHAHYNNLSERSWVSDAPTRQSKYSAHQHKISSANSTYSRSRPNSTYSNDSQKWMIAKHSCPMCSTTMMLNRYDSNHHCITCGATFPLPVQTKHHYDDTLWFDPSIHNTSINASTKNPFSIAHEQLISQNQGEKVIPNQQHVFKQYPTVPQQNHHMPRSFAGNGFSFTNHEYTSLQQPGHQQSIGLHSIQPPTPNYSRDLTNYFNDPTPNYNRLRNRMSKKQFYSDVGSAVSVKENSFGNANIYRQKPLSSVYEAKSRMENAQNATRREFLHYN